MDHYQFDLVYEKIKIFDSKNEDFPLIIEFDATSSSYIQFIYEELKKDFPKIKFYITTTNIGCPNITMAIQIKSKLILHFGEGCSFCSNKKFPIDIIYFYPERKIDIALLNELIKANKNLKNYKVGLFAKNSCLLNSFKEIDGICNENNIKLIEIPNSCQCKELYLNQISNWKMITNIEYLIILDFESEFWGPFILLFPNLKSIFFYNNKLLSESTKYNPINLQMRRMKFLQEVKDEDSIAILITKGFEGIENWNKKTSFLKTCFEKINKSVIQLFINDITEEKLWGFPAIKTFIGIGCPEHIFQKQFKNRKIISFNEALLIILCFEEIFPENWTDYLSVLEYNFENISSEILMKINKLTENKSDLSFNILNSMKFYPLDKEKIVNTYTIVPGNEGIASAYKRELDALKK